MIKSFRNKALAELWAKKKSSKIEKKMQPRIMRRLDQLEQVTTADGMNVVGFDFHALRGKPQRYSVHINGPWCVTFEFVGGHALRVDFEQYH